MVSGSPVSAAILMGGQSRRMGRDKADLIWQNQPLVQRIFERLNPLVDEVMLVVRPQRRSWAEELAPGGARVVCDQGDVRGPLAGIQAALNEARHERVLVVACDMPELQPRLLKALLDDTSADVVIPRTEAGYEPLLAVYHRNCLAAVEKTLAGGSSPVPAFFEGVSVAVWDEEALRQYDPELLSLVNFNRPDDLIP